MIHYNNLTLAGFMKGRSRASIAGGVVLLALLIPFAVGQGQEPQIPPEKVQLLSGTPMLIAADELGITEIAGKDISTAGSPPGNANAKKLKDVGIGIDPTIHENEPTLVANPKNKKKLVAGSHTFPVPGGVRCVAYTSSDGGATWSAPIVMPSLAGLGTSHSDPVLAYAPDGSRVYYAYMDIKGVDWDIVVSYSDNDGQTWTGPIIALNGNPAAFVYDKPWIGTHVDASQSNHVYVTATQFDITGLNPDHIAFARSGNKAVSWSGPTLLDAATFPVVVQGSRPTGGVGGEVLVAWYNSGADGWLTGGFEIRTRRSGDNGATWDPIVVASADNFECPYWLGPLASYHRWWGSMYPDVEIDAGGESHIVYTHDPDENLPYPFAYSLTSEDGDIRYISSAASPYNAWSTPATVNDDGLVRAQGYAALEIGIGGQLHAIWEDHRRSPEVPIVFPDSPNLYYDIFYSRNTPGQGTSWFSNFRVNEASSINDYVFIGDYNDLAANNTTLFGIWTDRRDKLSIFDFEDNVFGSRIIAGGGSPKALAEESEAKLPESYALYPNHPNPFNPETEIRFQIPEATSVVLKIYNTVGQEIRTLANAPYEAGYHKVRWDGKDNNGKAVASGVYFYQLQAGSFMEVRKMSLLR